MKKKSKAVKKDYDPLDGFPKDHKKVLKGLEKILDFPIIPFEREDYSKNPDNGKKGWWHVWGIRHAAMVRASSAPEAVEKA